MLPKASLHPYITFQQKILICQRKKTSFFKFNMAATKNWKSSIVDKIVRPWYNSAIVDIIITKIGRKVFTVYFFVKKNVGQTILFKTRSGVKVNYRKQGQPQFWSEVCHVWYQNTGFSLLITYKRFSDAFKI